MSRFGDTTTNGLQMSDSKTMWFEFLLQPKLLDSHLKTENSSPQPFEIITQLLTNALTISTTSLSALSTPNTITNGTEEPNGFAVAQQTAVDNLKRLMDSKKSTAIRYLSFKIMAHLNWDLNELENNLPPTQQDFLLSEFIRYCDQNESPTPCKLFAHILYYRWILRYILKSNYPLRASKGPLIPLTLQQQIDPCFVSNEALDCLMKKLQEQYANAVSDLEKVVFEKQKGNRVEVWMPSDQCFDAGNDFVCDWNRSVRVDINDVMDDILYDIGRWFFFREDYVRANTYFESISMSKRNSYNHLDGYLLSTRDLKTESDSKVVDIEVIDFEKQAIDSIEKLMNGNTTDITILECLDVNEVKKNLEKAFNKCEDKRQKNRLLRITKYLSIRIKGLNEQLNKTLFTKTEDKIPEIIIKDDDNDAEMFEEGEIDGDEEPVVKDPELLLLEATDPEVIQSLVCKTQKHPLMINSKWVLPLCQSIHLKHLSQVQYDKCHLILAKANQLRSAKLFIESRVMYLSLLEDIQTSLPQLADVIRWELLRTDLEYHFNTTDVDERQINDLIAKCNRTLRTIDKTNISTEFSELTELCCIFLLESCPKSLKDFFDSSVPVLKFSSCLSWLAFDSSSNTNGSAAQEFWLMVVDYFVDPNLVQQQNRKPITGSNLTFANSLVSFVSKFKDISLISIIISCLSKIHNIIRDNMSQELTLGTQFGHLWPSSLINSITSTLNSNSVSSALNKLLDEFLSQKPNELYLLRVKAELSLIDSLYADAIKYFTLILIITTKFFTSFSHLYSEEDQIIVRMIQCCSRLGCHTQSALLYQLTGEPNYAKAFKSLSEQNCNDSCDDLYECIWDTTLLEFLINLHHRRGEAERKTKAIQLMGQLELNANNSEQVLKEAADIRRSRLLRVFARTYL